MKSLILLFLLIPFFCFSQEDKTRVPAAKPSTTDCPTWKNKGKSKAAGKADYFQYLRTAKPPQTVPTAPTNMVSKVQPHTIPQRTKTPEPEKVSTQTIKTTSAIPQEPIPAITKNTTVTTDATSLKTEGTRVADPQSVEKSANPDKLDEEKTKLKRKLTLHTRKTTKVRKHSNSKCPSF